MLLERRKIKRLDMCIIVEFKASGSSMSSLGITKDFAGNGFSFESQDIHVEPGENLDFKFKNSESNAYVSAAGAIVWKKRNGEFGYLIGIRFDDLDDQTRRQMYEAVSATGHVSLNCLISGNCDDRNNHGESDSDDDACMYYDSADSYGTGNDASYAAQESSAQASSIHEEQLIPNVENCKSRDSVTGEEEAPFAHTFPVKINRRKKKPLYKPVLKIIMLLLLLLAAILIFAQQDRILESSPAPATIGPAIVKELEPALQIAYAAPLTNEESTKAPFLVQVGAWKNPEYSNEILPRLQVYYPNAYIVVENNFNIIRIPDIMHREQGWIMLEDIEDKFRLTGLVITNK